MKLASHLPTPVAGRRLVRASADKRWNRTTEAANSSYYFSITAVNVFG